MNGFNTKKKIALVVENLYTEFAQEMIQNAINCSRLYKNIDLVVIAGKYDNSRELNDNQHKYKRVFNTVYSLEDLCGFDGLIVSLGSMEKIKKDVIEERYFNKLKRVPKVFVVSDLEGQPTVNYDNESGINEAVDCLVNAYGFDKFGMLGGREDNIDARKRRTLYENALKRNNIDFTDDNYVSGDMSVDTQIPATELLNKNPDVQAIFCVNDASAVGLFDVMSKRGLVPGKDIMVFAFDNTKTAGRMIPTLASIGAAEVTLGQKAMEELILQMNGNPPRAVTIPTRLYGRESFDYEMYEYTTMEMMNVDKDFIYRIFDDCFYRYKHEFRDRESVNLPRLFFVFISRILTAARSKYMSTEEFEETKKLVDIFFENGAMDYTDAMKFIKSTEKLQNSIISYAGYNQHINRLFARMKEDAIVELAENKIIANDQLIFGRQRLQNMLIESIAYDEDTGDKIENLVRNFDKLGLENAAFFLFESSISYDEDREDVFPQYINLKCLTKNGELFILPEERQRGYTKDMFRRMELPSNCREFVAFPIFYKNDIYGFLLSEYNSDIANCGEYYADQLARTLYMNDNNK